MALSQNSIDTGSKQVAEACSNPGSKNVAQELQYYRDVVMQELEYLRRTDDQALNYQVDDDVASEEYQGKIRLPSPTLTVLSSHSAEIDSSAPGDEKQQQLGSPDRANCIDDLEPYLNVPWNVIPSATSTRFSSNAAEIDASSSDDQEDQLWPAERVDCIADLEPYLNALGYRITSATSSRFSSSAAEIDSSSSDDEENIFWSQERANCIDDLTPYLRALDAGHVC